MAEWIVPFAGRNHSTAVNCNFLWAEGHTYIMDNHRAAMWCWLRHLDATPLSLVHVDRHYDAIFSERDWELFQTLDVDGMGIEEYLSCGHESDFFTVTPLFRWDNYLGLFIKGYEERIETWFMATHGQGVKPDVGHYGLYPWHFPGGAMYREGRFIVNVDLDYFVFKDTDGQRKDLFSDDFFKAFLAPLKALEDEGRLACLTLCLSPECCGGWEKAEELCQAACEVLEIDFRLPVSE